MLIRNWPWAMGQDVTKLGSARTKWIAGTACLTGLLLPSAAFSQVLFNSSNLVSPFLLAGLPSIALSALGMAGFAWRKASRSNAILQVAKRRLGEVEYQLNEAETALQSESQILLTWPRDAEQPSRAIGTLHGLIETPTEISDLIDFSAWLELDSATQIAKETRQLRQSGSAFNFAVKTLKGDLLEIEGRAAGTMTTIRFRPLAGQRLEANENHFDTHKLVRQVERLSAILDIAPFPVWLADAAGKLTWVNAAYLVAAENDNLDHVLGHNILLAKPEALDRSKADPKRNLIGRMRLVHAGKPCGFNVHEFQIEGGKACFAIDVTGLEEAEKELDRHIKAHASTLDKLSTAIAIFGPDQRLRFANQAYHQLWDLDTAFLKTNPTDGEILDRMREQRLLPEQANFREWRAKQLQAYSKVEPREDYWYLPDGRSLRVICEQHPFGGVSYLYENLTKEYQLESRYNELFEVQRETLDNLAEAVALSGPDGRLKLFNPAFLRFWPMDKNFLAQLPHVNELAAIPGLSPASRAAWQDIKYSVTGLEANRKQHEGRIEQDSRMLHYRAVPLPDGNALLTFTDVSDSVRAEQALRDRAEALEATDRLKNAILTNVSYEVRTPLNSIMGYAEALDLGMMGALVGKQNEYIKAIRHSADDLKSIIDAMIDLSAIDAGQMELKLAKIDVATLLETTAEKFVGQLEKRQQDLTIELAADVSTIIGDSERLGQILGNLLSNASGFSAIGGKIHIGAKRQGENLMIWVADSGRGIEPEYQQKVFDRFQSKPMPGSHRGPGLGLALVKSFTELHGGKVSLVSKLDQGTTVVCTLPLLGPVKSGRNAPLFNAHNCMIIHTSSAQDTEHLARELALFAKVGFVILLKGDLGAGKSTFARAFIKALAPGGDDFDVPSPTFSLVQDYHNTRIPVAHIDLYRLTSPEQAEELGLTDLVKTHLLLIEWSGAAEQQISPNCLELDFSGTGESRDIAVTPRGAWGEALTRNGNIKTFLAAQGAQLESRSFFQGDASSRRYEKLIWHGREIILMDMPHRPDGPPVKDGKPYSAIAHLAEDVRSVIAINDYLGAQHYATPHIYACDLHQGLAILEDLGGQVYDHMHRSGQNMLAPMQAAVAVLADMATKPWPKTVALRGGGSYALSSYDEQAQLIEVDLLPSWFHAHIHKRPPPEYLNSSFADVWRKILPFTWPAEAVWVLRDYHSPNLIWRPEHEGLSRVGLIDTQDALLGHSAYDLASLLQDARVDIDFHFADELYKYYVSLRQSHGAFDEAEFARAYAILGAQRATKILGIFARLNARDGKPHYLQHMPRVARYLIRNLEHPVLHELKTWVSRHMPEVFAL